MLRYSVEKNGGIVTWDNNSKTATVTLNGITKQYRAADYDNINGRIIIDSKQLANDFKIEQEFRFHHASGDRFNSIDDAAIAFGLTHNKMSIDEKKEYGGSIYIVNENGIDKFAFNARFGGYTGVTIPKPPRGRTQVAAIHTHANYDASLGATNHTFSERDYTKMTPGVLEYLVTPLGTLVRYNPSTKEYIVLTSNMPYDETHPDRR